jgi:hypothetical protein
LVFGAMTLRVKVAGIAGVVLTLTSTSAMAQAVVCTNCFDELTAVAQNVVTAANWVTQLARMTQQIQEQILIFQQLSGLTNVNGMAAILNQAATFNQMNSFGNVAAMLQGAGGGIGAAYQEANVVFMPTAGSPMPQLNTLATLFNHRAGSLATAQGVSAQLLANSTVILSGLMTLQHEIDAIPSAQTMLGINSRLASYQGDINTQQYQLAQMRAFAAAQQKVFDEQEKQAVFCADYHWAADNPSLTGAGLNVAGEGHCAVAGGAVAAAAPVAAAPAIGTGGFDTPLPAAPTLIAAN